MKTVLALLIALSCCGLATAQTQTEEPPPTAEQIRLAYRQVQTAPHYSVGGAGFTGAPSEAAKALHILIRAKDARLFESLTQERNPVARLYGLIGMRNMAYPEVKRFAARLEQSDETVMVLRGCLMTPEKMSVLAQPFSVGPPTVVTKPMKKSIPTKGANGP
jgi:hypothetical protein